MNSSVAIDINKSFNQDISLHNLIHSEQVKKVLVASVDHYYAERSSGKTREYPMILLIGKTATTISHAVSNTFGNTGVKCMEGSYFSRGVGLDEFLMHGDSFCTYYIHRLEQMNDWLKPEISRILNDRCVREPEKVGVTQERYHDFGSLLICSTYNVDAMDEHLLDSFDVICKLSVYDQNSVSRILQQRLKYMGWKAEPSVPTTIADLSGGDVKLAINALKWTYRFSRIEGDEVFKVKHLNKALHLLK
jgi:Holliday junction resolvasome RuvABC ATP-dependent DNA helicase subunit